MLGTEGIFALLTIMFGLLELFFGFRIFRVLVVIAGAFVGFYYGPMLATALGGSAPDARAAVIFAILGAVILGLLAWFVFSAVVFLWGASIGYSLGLAAFSYAALPALLIAVAFGILAVLFQRFLIVLLTSLNGAWLVAASGAFFLGFLALPPGLYLDRSWPLPANLRVPLLIITLLLAILGSIVQFRSSVPKTQQIRRF